LPSGLLGDRVVQPIVETHSCPSGCRLGGVACSLPDARDIPCHGFIHVLDHRRRPRIVACFKSCGAAELFRLSW
jgi:hypothetical protein